MLAVVVDAAQRLSVLSLNASKWLDGSSRSQTAWVGGWDPHCCHEMTAQHPDGVPSDRQVRSLTHFYSVDFSRIA